MALFSSTPPFFRKDKPELARHSADSQNAAADEAAKLRYAHPVGATLMFFTFFPSL